MYGCIQAKTAPGLCPQPAQQLEAGPGFSLGAPSGAMGLLEVQKQRLAPESCHPPRVVVLNPAAWRAWGQHPRTSRGNPGEEKQQRRRGHRAVPFSTRLVLDVK